MRTLTVLHAAARERPDDDQARRALGDAYADLKQPEDALPHYEAARRLNPSSAGHWTACAAILAAAGRIEDAHAYYEHALALAPESPRVLAAFGQLLAEHGIGGEHENSAGHERGAWHESGAERESGAARAEAMLARAILRDPLQASAYTALGRVTLTRMAPAAAVDRLDTLLAGHAPAASIRAGVASALMDTGRYGPAHALYHAALDRAPESGLLLNKLGEAQTCLGEMDSALRTFARAVAAMPGSGLLFMAYVEHLIRLDRLDEAMRVCRQRADSTLPFGAFRRVPKESAHPDWRGTPIAGLTVMLRTNPRHGDALQFARFARLFREAGAHVIVETLPALVPLLRTLDGAGMIVTPYEETPPIDADLHPALGALLLPWTWDSLAAGIPYVHPPAAARLDARRRLGTAPGLRIGVNWQGAPLFQRDPHRQRSIPLAQFAPLASVPGVTLHSLQFGAAAGDAGTAPFAVTTPDMGDFLDTAAIVDALDLIVTVDTAMAHVAGALGKPCFVLLPYRADWRWMIDRDTSAFYPSLRLYRQTRPGDWTGPVAAIVRDVARIAAAESAGASAARTTTAAAAAGVALGNAHGSVP